MIEDFAKIVNNLSSPSDWAVVMGAATAGFILDGAINIVPIPFFSPGICGLSAASAAFSAKRGWDSYRHTRQISTKRNILLTEGQRCIEKLSSRGDELDASDLKWNIEMCGDDIAKLEDLIQDARDRVNRPSAKLTAPVNVARGGFGLFGRRATNLDEQ